MSDKEPFDPDRPDDHPDQSGDQPGSDQPGSDKPGSGNTGGPGSSESNSQPGLGPRPNNSQNEDSGAGNPNDPFAAMFGQLGGGDFSQLMQQVQQALSQLGLGQFGAGQFGAAAESGNRIGFQAPNASATAAGTADGVNWNVVRDVARKAAAAQGSDPTPTRAQQEAVADAVRLAQSWLDGATELPASSAAARAWSRAEWIEKTISVWQRLVDPVATNMASAMADTMTFGDGPEAQMLAGMEQMLKPMLRTSGSQMFGMQAGQGIGAVAGDILSGTDNGLPLLDASTIALVPSNIDAFADGLDGDTDDLLIYLALREAARQRLFAHATWLRPQVLALIEEYAKQITIDTSRLEELMGSAGGLDPESLQKIARQLQDNTLFVPARTPDQERILERLETLLALVEGWVDDVVATVAEKWLPNAEALAELIRRRRGAGGPAEETLTQLVGLELRPRKVREAAKLWQVLRQRSGAQAREAAWTHPDLLPSSEDLADPLGYAPGGDDEGDDFDAALYSLLDGDTGSGPDEPDSDADDSGPDRPQG